jgi:hypothetical protein
MAVFSLPVVLLAIIMARAGTFEAEPILVTFGASLVLAVLAILLAVAALVGIWFDGRAGAGFAFLAIAISVVLLAYPAYFAVKGYRLPAINDITTDPYDPPGSTRPSACATAPPTRRSTAACRSTSARMPPTRISSRSRSMAAHWPPTTPLTR